MTSLISISRPRFWIYEFGAYIVGISAAAAVVGISSLPWILLIILAFYFTLPANLYIYGINDIYDYETDKQNPKKQEYEQLLEPTEHGFVWLSIFLTTLPLVLLLFILPMPVFAIWWFGLFLFFAAFYSAEPLRAKTTPGFDSLFSGAHYVATGVFGFYLAGAISINWWLVLASLLWTVAMHAYSAVPDVVADRMAGLQTIATELGSRNTIWFCLGAYTLAGLIATWQIGLVMLLPTIIYIVMMAISIPAHKKHELFAVYQYFPTLNTLVGMFLFFLPHLLTYLPALLR